MIQAEFDSHWSDRETVYGPKETEAERATSDASIYPGKVNLVDELERISKKAKIWLSQAALGIKER